MRTCILWYEVIIICNSSSKTGAGESRLDFNFHSQRRSSNGNSNDFVVYVRTYRKSVMGDGIKQRSIYRPPDNKNGAPLLCTYGDILP